MSGAGTIYVVLCLLSAPMLKKRNQADLSTLAMFVLLCLSWQGSPKKCEAEEAEPPAATQPQTSETPTSHLPESERIHHAV